MKKEEKATILSNVASCRAAILCGLQSQAMEYLSDIEKAVMAIQDEEEEVDDWADSIEAKIDRLEQRVAFMEYINCIVGKEDWHNGRR